MAEHTTIKDRYGREIRGEVKERNIFGEPTRVQNIEGTWKKSPYSGEFDKEK